MRRIDWSRDRRYHAPGGDGGLCFLGLVISSPCRVGHTFTVYRAASLPVSLLYRDETAGQHQNFSSPHNAVILLFSFKTER